MNDLTFNQSSVLLNAVFQQATGQSAAAVTDTGSFVTLAQKTLMCGYDNIIGAISQVLGRTIFSIRPYNRKFKGLQVSEQKWGYITRKLTSVDKPFEDDARFTLTDGQSVDDFTVNKPDVLQVNFYGQNLLQKSVTIFKDQLDNAFTGPDQFGSFMAMIMQNISDMFEQAYEIQARLLLANLITGRTLSNPAGSVIHLVTEYKTLVGDNTLTLADLRKPDKYPAFMKWIYARVATLTALMTERSHMFHVNITNKAVARHTPLDKQKVYLLASERFGLEAQVLADTYHDNYLKYADVETVNFWQAIQFPSQIIAKPSYLAADGTITYSENNITLNNVFGVIFDEDTLGYTVMNRYQLATRMNAKAAFTNLFYHQTLRFWQDDTENAMILLLD